jgi:hypothetical protein
VHTSGEGYPLAGRVADVHFTVSHRQPTLIAIDTQPNDEVRPPGRSGKADRLAGETLDPSPQGHPLEGFCQVAILLPYTTLGIFCVVFRRIYSTPDWRSQTHPCFRSHGVGSDAPHQSPIRIKASRRLASSPDVCPWHRGCPRKPSVPCRVQSCTAYRSHGSLAGPTLTGLTAEASHHSAMRWQALCQRLRPGLIR